MSEARALRSNEFEASGLETTLDAFHNGAFKVLQPKGSGHRSGMDALLLAAALPATAKGVVADLGSGVGVAGLAALNLNRELDLLCVENNATLLELAVENISLPANRDFKSRTKILEADITGTARDREVAGLVPESVSHVIMNPPYNSITLRPSPDPVKAAAHVMGEGGLDAWFRTAASIIKPGGTMTMIYRTEQLGDIVACTHGRFGGLELLPIHSRVDEPAKRLMFRGTRGSRAPLSIMPGIVLHNADGSFTELADQIFKGNTRLPFAS